MFIRQCSSFLRAAFLMTIVAGMFLGCAGRQRKSELLMLQEELGQKSERVNELEQENAELRNKVGKFEGAEIPGFEPEAAKALLESKLAGTGVTVQTTGRQIRLLLPSATLFGVGQTTLKEGAKSPLKKVASAIKTNFPTAVVRVEGHTDSAPIKKLKKKYKSNWELSAVRAATVAHFFVSECSFDPTKIYIAGFGEYRPIASNKNKAGQQKNRRVEIVILSRDAG